MTLLREALNTIHAAAFGLLDALRIDLDIGTLSHRCQDRWSGEFPLEDFDTSPEFRQALGLPVHPQNANEAFRVALVMGSIQTIINILAVRAPEQGGVFTLSYAKEQGWILT